MHEDDRRSIAELEADLRAQAAVCTHQHYAIIGPTIGRLGVARIECLDCCMVAEWHISGVKKFDEATRAEICAWMEREYPHSHK